MPYIGMLGMPGMHVQYIRIVVHGIDKFKKNDKDSI